MLYYIEFWRMAVNVVSSFPSYLVLTIMTTQEGYEKQQTINDEKAYDE